MAGKKTKNRKKNIKLLKLSRIIWVCSILIMILLGYFIYDANILPFKYYMMIVIVFVILLSIHGLLTLKKNTRSWVLITLNILSLCFMSGEVFAICKINDTIQFLRTNLGVRFETNIYNIVVNKESSYQSLEDIKDKTALVYKDTEDLLNFETAVKRKVSLQFEYKDDVMELFQSVMKEKEQIVIVNSGNYDAMVDADKDFEDQVRILDTIEMTVEIESTSSGINITKDPFVIYLSGIDTRSGTLPSRSLSDVNIILAVNPNTRRILMIHIPRDYYVPLHGYNGAKDKLTHAGTIGGIELSMATIEDLLEIEIPYYVRVNFNAVVNLVDAIGGITLNSDVNYSFSCWTDRGCSFQPGLNTVSGRCALAFARERHAYETGDRHRGENQEQVIEVVINKVTSSSTLISNYSEILNALNGTFQTNITSDEITSLVKMQLDDMSGWHIESSNVSGSGASLPTYSYPSQNLYVMNPNMETVQTAVRKLNEVLETP